MHPDLTRCGGSIPVALVFKELLGPLRPVLLVPVGQPDDGAHSQNEKISIRNFVGGVRFSHFWQISHLQIILLAEFLYNVFVLCSFR